LSYRRHSTSYSDPTNDLISMIQFDHWVLSSASPVFSLMSHDDIDHNPETCTSYGSPIIVSSRFVRDLQTQYIEVRPKGVASHDGIEFWLNYNKLIEIQGTNPQVHRFHSDWWNVLDRKSQTAVLFIGNIDFVEVQLIETYVDYILNKAKRPLSAVPTS
jgi:hypothetical protein